MVSLDLNMIPEFLKKDKKDVAIFFKGECNANSSHLLEQFLDYILGPRSTLDKKETIEWCKALISGDQTYSSFCDLVHSFNNSSLCGLVWNADYVAYRCRTCAKTPCMSLCSECFMAADHTDHDFNMFKSQAGGACDCGDENVMDTKGFCTKHCKRLDGCTSNPPGDLLVAAQAVIPMLLINLVRSLGRRNDDRSDIAVLEDAKNLIGFLQELSDMGTIMQNILCNSICDEVLYTANFRGSLCKNCEYEKYQEALLLLDCKMNISTFFPELSHLDKPLVHNTILDELYFWTIKYQFYQGLVTFILSLLPNETYKSNFVVVFMKHYTCSMNSICSAEEKSKVSNAIVHISVQLLSPMYLAVQTVEKHHLMHLMLVCLGRIITPSLVKTASDKVLVVNCSQGNLKEHCYWPIVTDVVNVLSHGPVIKYFLSNFSLIEAWANVVSYFQGMNANRREKHQHLEFEPEGYYQAFSAELEICSTPLWTMLMHLDDPSLAGMTSNVVRVFATKLQEWLEAAEEIRADEMSFHYPLHRYLSLFISNAIQHQGMDSRDLILFDDFLRKLLIHPLHLLACYSEINCNVWVRNGQQIKGQAMFYTHWNFASSTMDPDYFLIQLVASRLDPDEVVMTILKEYHAMDVLSLGPPVNKSHFQVEHELPMLESCLYFIATLLDTRVLSGDVKNLIPNELIGLLCVADRTHSHLTSSIPDRCGSHNPGWINAIEAALPKVSHFKPPAFEIGTSPQQGRYLPQPQIWIEKYNPLFVRMRTLYKKDYQASHDRFCQFVKQQNLFSESSTLWPPFRLPEPIHPSLSGLYRILQCSAMHALIFSLLYKALTVKSFPDSILHLTIHLLHLAITFTVDTQQKTTERNKEFNEGTFSSWFSSDNIFENAFVSLNPTMSSSESADNNDKEKCFNKFNSLLQEGESSKSLEGHFPDCQNDSIITMLIKLYARFSKEPYFYDGSLQNQESYIGDGKYFLKKVLDKFCSKSESCAKEVMNLLKFEENISSNLDVVQDRRSKAKLRQQRLLSDFASKQKKFMEEAIDTVQSESVEDEPPENVLQRTYDCCICSLSTPSTSSQPVCMAAQILPTSILGCQKVENSEDVSSYSTRMEDFNTSLINDFHMVPEVQWYKTSCLHTCGHFMHFNCYISYTKSLQNQNPLSVAVEKGEFFCPMCRQISNSVLPIIEKSLPLTQFIPCGELKATGQIEKLMEANFHEIDGDTRLNQSINSVLDDFWQNSTCKPYSHFLFSASLLRNNLELNLLSIRSKKRFNIASVTRKHCIYPLYVLLSNSSKKCCPSFLALLWRHITTDSLGCFEKFAGVPLFLKDVSDIFLQFLLALPFDLDENHFLTLARVMYNVKLIQTIIHMVCNSSLEVDCFSRDSSTMNEFEDIIKAITSHIPESISIASKFQDEKMITIDDVELFMAEHLLPYLRLVSLVHHCIYKSFLGSESMTFTPIYSLSPVLEFQELSRYLHLTAGEGKLGFIGLSKSEGMLLIQKVCRDVKTLGFSSASKLKNLIRFHSFAWDIPMLIQLPEEFDTLFQNYRKQTLKDCHKIPKCCSLCLICNDLICYKDGEDVHEYILHSRECGNGTGLFIGIDSSFVVIMQNKRIATWGSLYLDKHGEEDKNLRRGKPLFLNKERYNLLNHMWLAHSLDQLCKLWTFHGNLATF